LGFKQEQKNGKDLGYAYLEKYSENDAFKVKGDKNRKGFRIWSTNEEQIFSYNQGSMFSIKGGYYMWKVDKKDPWNDYHMEDYYTRFIFDDKTQSLTAKIPSLFSEYPLAITEGKKGTQIYQKMLYNGMMMKNTRFCFVAHYATKESDKTKGEKSEHVSKVNKPEKTEAENENQQESITVNNEQEKAAMNKIEVLEETSAGVTVKQYIKLGAGWCRPKECDLRNENCRVNGFFKDKMTSKECKSACDEDGECQAYASSDQDFTVAPRRCFLYGPMTGKHSGEHSGWTKFQQKETSTLRTNGAKHVECFVNNEFYQASAAVEWSIMFVLFSSFAMY